MFTLLHEIHFWTQKDAIFIKDTDFGAFMYYEKKQTPQSLFWEGKRNYMNKRGILWSPSNKRPKKLKDSLKELEELINHHRIVTCLWRSPVHVQIFLGTGLKITIKVNYSTGDVEEINFDKYMVGKLCSTYISDVSLSESHALFAYTENQVTLIQFMKPSTKYAVDRKWSCLDPKLQIIELSGPSGRKVDKRICFNTLGNMILVWWKCSRDEVYPWSPSVKDEERANVHVYSLLVTKLELLCYYRTEFDPVNISFSLHKSNVVHVIQQKISLRGEVTLEWSTMEITRGQMDTTSILSLLLPTHSCVTVLSPKEDKLFIGCIDGSVLITDQLSGTSQISKAAFIPSMASWHPDASLILLSNERGQIQWFDRALNPVKSQTMSEDSSPSNILDIGSYFNKFQPTLLNTIWNRCPKTEDFSEGVDDFLLMYFERGPLGTIRFIRGCGLPPPVLVFRYLTHNSLESALSILLSLCWTSDGDWAIASLQAIVSHLLRLPLSPETEDFLERALGSYHKPKHPIPESVEFEFGDSVHDLSRRFFHHLLRYQIHDKAFRLAIDLDDYDLFMDIHNYAKEVGNMELAIDALERADQVSYSNSISSGESSDCDCSCSSDERQRTSPPPLPVLTLPPRQKVKFSSSLSHIGVPSTSQEAVTPFLTEDVISPNMVGLPRVDFPPKPLFRPSLPGSGSDTSKSLPDLKPLCLTTNPPPSDNFENRLLRRNGSLVNLDDVESGKIKVVHFGLV